MRPVSVSVLWIAAAVIRQCALKSITSTPTMPDYRQGGYLSRSGAFTGRVYLLARIRHLLRECLAEVASFLHRVRFQYRRAVRLEGAGIGSLVEPDYCGGLRPSERSLACIEETKRFAASHPWVTEFDRMLFRQAWLAGARWSEGEASNSVSEEAVI